MAYQPKTKFLFAPDNWDDGWRTALRTASSAGVNVGVVGDSFTMGSPTTGLTDVFTQSWYALLRTSLIAKYPHSGDFWGVQWSNAVWNSLGLGATMPGTAPWTMNTTLVANGSIQSGGWGYVMFHNPTPAGNLASFATPYACTDLDIIVTNYLAGTWTYTVDGGAPVTITSDTTNGYRRIALTGLSNATHTIAFTGQSTGNALLLHGIVTYKPGQKTAGLRFTWTACHGAPLSQFTTSAITPYDQSQAWQGRTSSVTTGFGFPGEPDLFLIAIGINDCRGIVFGYSLEGYQAGLRRLCQSARRARANCSILFMANSNPDGISSDVTNQFTNSIAWPLYIDKMINIAVDYNCALVNFQAKWGETGVAQGFQIASDAHPTIAGHADINTTLSFLA